MEKSNEGAHGDMRYYDSVLQLMGNTPLVRLSHIASDVPRWCWQRWRCLIPGVA